jgi:hypothetical protein
MSDSKKTTDLKEIKKWAEARDGKYYCPVKNKVACKFMMDITFQGCKAHISH